MLRNKSFRKQSRKVRLFMLFGSLCTAFIIILFTNYRQGNVGYIAEDTHFASRKLLNTSDSGDDSLYPPDAFTDEQLKNGAVALHVIGLIYMFIALAIVCDEFFVPALGVIIERFKITEDVAGATFMAAGGSAPELFTSLFGIFFAKSNVGIGTIVGSAVFNILFVIGMCAIFSKTVLNLTWWPLFRDVTFYSIDLILLIAFFYDEVIKWHEALILFFGYVAYVLFMKFNAQIEDRVKSCLKKRCNKVETQERPERSLSMPILHAGGNRFRHGILDLIIHSNHHNLHEESKINSTDRSSVTNSSCNHSGLSQNTLKLIGNHYNRRFSIAVFGPHLAKISAHITKPHEKAVHLHALETLKVVIGVTTPGHGDHNGQTNHNGSVDQENNKLTAYTNGHITSDNGGFVLNEGSSDIAVSRVSPITPETPDGEDKKEELQEEEEPLDLSWPKEWRKRLNYILVAPIIFPLWIFLPDVRRPEKKRWFIITFFGSILWIAIYSYLMLWWASTVGKTIGIQDEIMGLTIIAAGTSIPDLITSVIVAKKGFGDMAVSSSVGSNIFDITVGLPIPWLIYLAINGGVVDVNSNGLVCSIFLLFVMLITVIATIAISKWKMSKPLGGSMLVLYVVFVVLSVLLEVSVIKCPVT